MSQILDSLPDNISNRILCCYHNQTPKIQIARITNVPNWYFERVVFPGERLLFETDPGAKLEIHMGMMASAIHSDTIPCDRLKISSSEDNQAQPTENVDFSYKSASVRKMGAIRLKAS